MSKTYQIPVIQGGRLVTTLSKNIVGPADYVQKDNWRRQRDVEIRREGWLAFAPLAAIANQGVYDAALTCTRIIELVRPDGTKALIGFSRSAVKLFSNTLGTWSTIGSGYSASGKRWQVVTINGTLIANNGVDLPFYYEVGDGAVTPMYELREVGIASVGRIAENNGFLVIADITEIQAILLQGFMRGWSTYTVGSTVAKAADYTIVNADSGKQFNFTTGNLSTKYATLPAAPTTGFYVWIKKVDVTVGGFVSILPMGFSMSTVNDTVLVWWDEVTEQWALVFFPSGVIPADAPYGIPPSNITNRFPWAVANSEYGLPTQWAPVFSVLMTAASATIDLPFASTVFDAGETRVAVINGGPLGGTLGGQEDSPYGILVTGVSGRTLTLETSTDASLTYPRVVQVLRWTDVSSLVGRYLLQGDNSAITSLVSLRNWLIVCRETGFYLGRYTGDPGAPFVFTPSYSGPDVPLWPDAIANVKSDYILYPARGNRMYQYDGVTFPKLHDVCDDAGSLFFGTDSQAAEIYAVDNTITREWWFCYPDRTIAFDYDTPGGTVSKIDQLFDAAAIIHKTNTTDVWMVMAIGRFIYTYGLVYGITPIQTWLRAGVAVQSVMKFGLNAFGDNANEKLLLNFTPILASSSPDVDLEVQIYSAHNPSATPVALLAPVESLPTPQGNNFVTLCFQALYVQDQITLVEATDIDAHFQMRIWEVEYIGGRGITRSIN